MSCRRRSVAEDDLAKRKSSASVANFLESVFVSDNAILLIAILQ
jgi:hypothetical protein